MKTHRRKDWTRNPARLAECRTPGPCEMCGRWCFRREPHHVKHRGSSGSALDFEINTVALGSVFDCSCHYTYHGTRHGTAETFWRIVAEREHKKGWVGEWEDVEAAVRFLLTLPRCPLAARVRADLGLADLPGAVWCLVERSLVEARV